MRAVLLLAVLALSACGGKSPTAPTPTACQANNTAILTFENRTTTRTHDVYLDNAQVALLGPGQVSREFTVAASVQHTVIWRYTNTTGNACVATPIPATCSTQLYFCAF